MIPINYLTFPTKKEKASVKDRSNKANSSILGRKLQKKLLKKKTRKNLVEDYSG